MDVQIFANKIQLHQGFPQGQTAAGTILDGALETGLVHDTGSQNQFAESAERPKIASDTIQTIGFVDGTLMNMGEP